VLGTNAGAPASSPLEFDSITATYQISNGVVTTQDLVYTSRAMQLSGAGSYSTATGTLNLGVVVDHGRRRTLARVTGTTANPSVRMLASSAGRGGDPERVRRELQDLLSRFP
jgi:uncharacterized protein YhdP